MRNNLSLTHDAKYAKEHIETRWEDFKVDEFFYQVNKRELERLLSREQRVNFLPAGNPSDKVILKTVMKFAAINSKHIAKQIVNVDFTEKEGVNYASLQGQAISISLSPFFDHRIPLDVRFNVVAGLIDHELFHCRYTTPALKEVLLSQGYSTSGLNKFGKEVPVADFKQLDKILLNSLFKDIFNILEDFRIEKVGLREYPGYVFFFDDLRRYAAWRRNNIMHQPADSKVTIEKDPLHQDQLLLDYIFHKVLLPEGMSTFEKLNDFTTETRTKCAQVDYIVDHPMETLKEVLSLTTQLYSLFSKEFKDHHTSEFPFPTIELTEEMLEALDELMQEIMQELGDDDGSLLNLERKRIMPNNNKVATPFTKLDITAQQPQVFDSEVYREALVISRSIKSNLAFLDSRFNRTTEFFELRHGELDESALYSLKFKNRDLFYDEEEAPGYSLDIAVLVDESGSMSGRKIKEARIATMALALALKSSEHINLFVYGHTADRERGKELSMYRYLDPFNRAENISSLFGIEARASNADGYAIEQMGLILNQTQSKQKVLIVVSDGQPAASCYGGWFGGDSGIEHTAKAVKQLEQKGVFVVQVAVGEVRDSDKMFTNFIPYDGAKLGQNLKQILNKKLVEISNFI